MTLDPQTQAVLDAYAKMNLTPPDQLSVADARAQFMRGRAAFLPAPEPVASVVDTAVPGPGAGLRVRLYRPAGVSPEELLPALLFFHGGGWVFGNLDSHDPLCRSLCNGAQCAVLSVDYRLAPESRFPAAVDDAIAALRHVSRRGRDLGIDTTRIAAAGDSAGGTLVAVAALHARDNDGPRMKLQVLLYPVTDLALTSPSYRTLGQGYLLTYERMLYFRERYLRGADDIADWRASPLQAQDLSNLPPALIITASHDPLVDEGKAYADRLAASGVPVTYRCYPGVVHGFMTMTGAIDAGKAAVAETAAAVKHAFSKDG